MKHILLFALFICAGLCFAQTPKTGLTYDQALLIASQNNETLKQAQVKIQQKEQESLARKGLYYPTVSVSANYALMTDKIHLDLTPVRDAITPLYDVLINYGEFSGVPYQMPDGTVITLPDDQSTEAIRAALSDGKDHVMEAEWDQTIQEQSFGMVTANFMMPIYTGGKIRIANKAAQIEVEEAHAESRQKRGEMTMELIERYYGLLLASKVEHVRNEVLRTMESHMEDAQKLQHEGIISNTEYLHAKVYYTEAKREKEKSKRQVSIVNDALKNTLAIDDVDTEIEAISPFFYHDSIESLAYFKSQAIINSPLLEQVEHKKQLAEQKLNLEKGSYMPNIAAMGSYNLVDKDFSPYLPDGTIGVGLTWTVFEGNARSKHVKAARLQSEQVDLYYSKSKANIETMLTKCYNEVKMQRDQIEQIKTSKEFATEYFEAKQLAFKEGMATTSEISDASLLLEKVAIEELQAAYAYDVALSKLLYYAGIPEQYGRYTTSGTLLQ